MSRLVRGGRVTWTRDVLRDVLVEMGARRSRSVLAVVAVALSVGALLASVGLSRAAARQVDADLAAATLDMVTVTVAHASGTDAEGTTFPSDAPARVTALAPVVGAGLRIDVSPLRATSVTRAPVAGSDPQDAGLLVSGMTSGYLEAAQADAGPGARWLDHEEPVVLLGVRAAAALHVPVTDDPRGLSVWVDGRRHDVVGFLDEGRTDLERVVAIPYRGAVRSVGGDREARMLIRSVPGAGPSSPTWSVWRSDPTPQPRSPRHRCSTPRPSVPGSPAGWGVSSGGSVRCCSHCPCCSSRVPWPSAC